MLVARTVSKVVIVGLFVGACFVAMYLRLANAADCHSVDADCVLWNANDPPYPGYCCLQEIPWKRAVPARYGDKADRIYGSIQCGHLETIDEDPFGQPRCSGVYVGSCGGAGASDNCTPKQY